MKKFTEIRGTLKEAKQGKLPDPPPTILMRRKAVRVFPNGQRIALYHNDRLNLDVSVPYFPGQLDHREISMATVKEEVQQLDETIIKKLQAISKSGVNDDVKFADGTKVKVQPSDATKILKLYGTVNFTNRVNLTRFVSTDPKKFKSVMDFISQNQV